MNLDLGITRGVALCVAQVLIGLMSTMVIDYSTQSVRIDWVNHQLRSP